MKGAGSKNAWALFLLLLAGVVLGGFIGGQSFGIDDPIVLNLGVMVITFGLSIKITMASIIGVILSIIIYRFL